MTWLADMDTSGPAGAYRSPSPYHTGRSTSPVPRVPGYIPGMPRPVTPHRDTDLEDVRSMSTTPRAAASSVPQDRATTSSPQYPSPTSSLLRQSMNTSPTPYGARPKSPHSSVKDRHGNPRNGAEHTSLNSHWRRPSSPLSSNSTAFQSLNGGSRPSTPSNVTWNVPGRESTQTYRTLGRNGTLLGHSRNPSNSSVSDSPNKAENENEEPAQNGLRSPRPVYSPTTSDEGRGPEVRPKFLSNTSILSASALAFVDFNPSSEQSSVRGSDSSPSQDPTRSTSVSSTLDDKSRGKQRLVSPLLTPPTSPFGPKHSDSSLFIPPTSNNSSRSSLVSIGSSYHSTEDDGARFAYAPERSEPAWHDIPTSNANGGSGHRLSSQVLAVDDPANILRQFTGLTKLDLVTIQGKLLDAAEARARNSEVRAPSTLRRRRPSTAASVHSIGGQQSRVSIFLVFVVIPNLKINIHLVTIRQQVRRQCLDWLSPRLRRTRLEPTLCSTRLWTVFRLPNLLNMIEMQATILRFKQCLPLLPSSPRSRLLVPDGGTKTSRRSYSALGSRSLYPLCQN